MEKKKIHIKVDSVACIEHENCRVYGFCRKECDKIHLAGDTSVHVRELSRMKFGYDPRLRYYTWREKLWIKIQRAYWIARGRRDLAMMCGWQSYKYHFGVILPPPGTSTQRIRYVDGATKCE